jgi:hypothetical protein
VQLKRKQLLLVVDSLFFLLFVQVKNLFFSILFSKLIQSRDADIKIYINTVFKFSYQVNLSFLKKEQMEIFHSRKHNQRQIYCSEIKTFKAFRDVLKDVGGKRVEPKRQKKILI